MHAQAQGVAIFEWAMAADPDHTLMERAGVQLEIAAVGVGDEARLDSRWHAEAPRDVVQFNRYLGTVLRGQGTSFLQ